MIPSLFCLCLHSLIFIKFLFAHGLHVGGAPVVWPETAPKQSWVLLRTTAHTLHTKLLLTAGLTAGPSQRASEA